MQSERNEVGDMNKLAVKNKPLWILKGCKRCGGDLHLEGTDYHCLLCGWIEYNEVKPRKSLRKGQWAKYS